MPFDGSTWEVRQVTAAPPAKRASVPVRGIAKALLRTAGVFLLCVVVGVDVTGITGCNPTLGSIAATITMAVVLAFEVQLSRHGAAP